MVDLTDFDNCFVLGGREDEYRRLLEIQRNMLSGKPSIAFVVGDAGTGKTSLVKEFSRYSEESDAQLLVVWGQCSSLINRNVSFLAFKEVTAILSGEGEDILADRVISRKNKIRLRKSIAIVGETVLKYGPDLLGIFIPTGSLIGNAAKFIAEKAGWLDKLKRLSRPTNMEAASQELLFEQYTRFVFSIAEQIPLLIVLDDLHWADLGTLDLLFYILRRLKNRKDLRLLIVGAFRESDVYSGDPGIRHPLETIVNETKLAFGNAIIDLSHTLEGLEGKKFIEAYLDKVPNSFGDNFKDLMYRQTQGHPLFFVEMLKMLAEKEIIQKSLEGKWENPIEENLEQLPIRVEAVIDERIAQLEKAVRDALTCASVEGIQFSAQVVAKIEKLQAREWLLQLSRELDKKYHLVGYAGSLRIGENRIDQYKFRHILFQKYLYAKMSQEEKKVIHGEIGEILEELYNVDTDLIAEQLALHFDIAGKSDKALKYYRTAAKKALQSYSYSMAAELYTRCLQLVDTKESEYFELLCEREEVFDRLGNRYSQIQDLNVALDVATTLARDNFLALVYSKLARYNERVGNYSQLLKYASLAYQAARNTNNIQLIVETLYWTSRGMAQLGQFADGKKIALKALDYAEKNALEQEKASLYTVLGWIRRYHENNYEIGIDYDKKALEIHRKNGNRIGEVYTLNDLAVVYRDVGHYDLSRNTFLEALELTKSIGDRRGEGNSFQRLGTLYLYLGMYHAAQDSFRNALSIRLDINDKWGLSHTYRALGGTLFALNRFEEAETSLDKALSISREINSLDVEAWTLFYFGLLFEARRELETAKINYQKALDIHSKSEWYARCIDDRAGLARVALKQNNYQEAKNQIEFVVQWLKESGPNGIYKPSEAYLTCIQVLNTIGDYKSAQDVMSWAYKFITETSNKIDSTALKKSYLTNLPANVEIVKLYESGEKKK